MNLEELEKLEHVKPHVSVSDAAALLGINRQSAYKLVKTGTLESFPFLGSRRVVYRSVIHRLKCKVKISNRALAAMQ
jgi:predicted DNA-binding transcriptional regulator AlpA